MATPNIDPNQTAISTTAPEPAEATFTLRCCASPTRTALVFAVPLLVALIVTLHRTGELIPLVEKVVAYVRGITHTDSPTEAATEVIRASARRREELSNIQAAARVWEEAARRASQELEDVTAKEARAREEQSAMETAYAMGREHGVESDVSAMRAKAARLAFREYHESRQRLEKALATATASAAKLRAEALARAVELELAERRARNVMQQARDLEVAKAAQKAARAASAALNELTDDLGRLEDMSIVQSAQAETLIVPVSKVDVASEIERDISAGWTPAK